MTVGNEGALNDHPTFEKNVKQLPSYISPGRRLQTFLQPAQHQKISHTSSELGALPEGGCVS